MGFAYAALETVGIPFRLHGRDWRTGLDCLGVIAEALRRINRPCDLPLDYQLRNTRLTGTDRWAATLGFGSVQGPVQPGDVLLLRLKLHQHHFMIAAPGGGYVHAHAGLRRVVHSPAAPDDQILMQWRLLGEE
ncbi:hypothetical protein GTZ99_14175 [Novosphingobium sp. FSY-8]|uniref:NlpC/P60 family protein n=1 Tax=Novosphingobium ovatum TaxID=1908523 RepID=A0ABW9XGN5_9SPHN|nr:hypothetical protein [Novosphingobium ovatum]NBC37698.1 hypothetical protein [Novosphingobium ovatum]